MVLPMSMTCALCGRPRADVTKLVSGEAGSICDECVSHALAFLDTDPSTRVPGRYKSTVSALTAVLEALPRKTALRDSAPLFRALVALADGNLDDLRALVSRTWSLGQCAMVLEIFATFPDGALTFGDMVDRADALYYLGRCSEVLSELDSIDEGTLEDGDRAALWSLRAAASSRLAWPEMERAEPAIDAADAIIAASRPDEKLDEAFRPMLSMARIRLALARGRPDVAAPYLAHLDPNFAEPSLVIGEVHSALSQWREATASLERALELSHPESQIAQIAREKLGIA